MNYRDGKKLIFSKVNTPDVLYSLMNCGETLRKKLCFLTCELHNEPFRRSRTHVHNAKNGSSSGRRVRKVRISLLRVVVNSRILDLHTKSRNERPYIYVLYTLLHEEGEENYGGVL